MKKIISPFNNRLTLLALGCAVALAASGLAFTEKTKNDTQAKPETQKVALNVPLDEHPISRDLGGRTSFAPVVKILRNLAQDFSWSDCG